MNPNLHRLSDLLDQSTNALGESIIQMKDIDFDRRKEAIDQIVSAIGAVFYVRTMIPGLDINDEIPEPDGPLTTEQNELVSRLTAEQLETIDNLLLAEAHTQWRKAARIVGFAMMNDSNRVNGIPDVFYAQRLRRLAEIGLLEAEGNLDCMRFCEYRLPPLPEPDN